MNGYTALGLLILAIVALVLILRSRKVRLRVKAPGLSLEAEGEDQPSKNHASPGNKSSAMTKIGGRVVNSKVSTKSGSGTAQTEIAGDVQKADIQTEIKD